VRVLVLLKEPKGLMASEVRRKAQKVQKQALVWLKGQTVLRASEVLPKEPKGWLQALVLQTERKA
jgi:hypothetical protein